MSQIKPPYPASGSAEWWDLRKSLMASIATDSRRRGTKFTLEQVTRSERATLTSLDDEEGRIAFERNGFSREQWLKRWNKDALSGDPLNIAAMRETLASEAGNMGRDQR